MTTPTTTVLASVFDDGGRCIGFVLKRGKTGFEATGREEVSLGLFSTAQAVAAAVMNAAISKKMPGHEGPGKFEGLDSEACITAPQKAQWKF